MPVTIVPLPRKPWGSVSRLFELRKTVWMVLKDRRRFYFKQGRSFAGLREDFPLPQSVEIETINKCNSTCHFCPVNRFSDPRPLTRMPEKLFHKIIDDLASHHYSGSLALYSNNEAFLDKRIFDFAAYARGALPRATIKIFTNGTALDITKVERILPNLDLLRINNYGHTAALHPNIARIVEHFDTERPDLAPKIQVYRRLLTEFGSNRAGNAPNRKRFSATYRSRCAYPFFQMVVAAGRQAQPLLQRRAWPGDAW
jgi:hypothetical protein